MCEPARPTTQIRGEVPIEDVYKRQAWKWQSTGVDGYTIEPCEKDTVGTDIIMHIKPDTEEEKDESSQYLREYPLYKLVKKYSCLLYTSRCV